MELVTSLTLLKMAINGGQMPPLTPLTEKALKVFDPAFAPGGGVLNADEEKGLQCPFRGCGKYYRALSTHVTRVHKEQGGVKAMRDLLSFPLRARFTTPALREKRRAAWTRRPEMHRQKIRELGLNKVGPRAQHRHSGPQRATVAERNIENMCKAQIRAKVLNLKTDLRRIPTFAQFAATCGDGLTAKQVMNRVVDTYGSWNLCLTACGISDRSFSERVGVEQLLESLRAWFDVHGDLPSQRDLTVHRYRAAPMMFSFSTYIRRLDPTGGSWVQAMRVAASRLGIYEPHRYGVPVHEDAA